MNVGFDVAPLVQTRAGAARYITNLLRHLTVEVRRFSFGGAGPTSTLVRETLWYPVLLPRAAARARVDVLHCPTYRAPLRSSVPLVVTVHDVAAYRHPETFNRWTRTVVPLLVPRVLAAARVVIAVSEFTRRELVELLRVPESKIRVVPNAVDAPFEPDGAAADGDYVLAVGTLEPRKNLARAAEAARRAGLELRVVAYPSLYEGFGIPILEAMACGAPVVTSAGGATEEVAGGAAVLVEPTDVDAIATGIREALSRGGELRARGLERARSFDWGDVARRTADVYREVV